MSKHWLNEVKACTAVAEGVGVHRWHTDSKGISSSLSFLQFLSAHAIDSLLLLWKSCKPQIGYCYQRTRLHGWEEPLERRKPLNGPARQNFWSAASWGSGGWCQLMTVSRQWPQGTPPCRYLGWYFNYQHILDLSKVFPSESNNPTNLQEIIKPLLARKASKLKVQPDILRAIDI